MYCNLLQNKKWERFLPDSSKTKTEERKSGRVETVGEYLQMFAQSYFSALAGVFPN